jgi:hypothetical protein
MNLRDNRYKRLVAKRINQMVTAPVFLHLKKDTQKRTSSVPKLEFMKPINIFQNTE